MSWEVQEYQQSVALVSTYTEWQTEHEEGSFPEFETDLGGWKHANTDYSPGRFIKATGQRLAVRESRCG